MPVPVDLLRSEQAIAVRRTADALLDRPGSGRDELALVTTVRQKHPDLAPELVSAVVTQALLAVRARARLGAWALDMLLEPTALEQATRRDVARYRAASLVHRVGMPAPRVVDLGCGIGVDARALAEAGCAVTVVDSDPWKCAAAQVNAELSGIAVARPGDVREVDPLDFDAAFVDPARRDPAGPRNAAGGRHRAIVDPAQWSPPWPWVVATSALLPLAAKLPPGISMTAIPATAEVEWIDHGGDTVEACVWFAPLAGRGDGEAPGPLRRASVVDAAGRSATITASADERADPIAHTLGGVLIEPAPAVLRAGLIDELARQIRADRIHPDSSWLTADHVTVTPLARTWIIEAELPARPKPLRAALSGRGSVTWKTTDVDSSAHDQDRRVGHRPARGGAPATVVLTADGRAFEVSRAGAD